MDCCKLALRLCLRPHTAHHLPFLPPFTMPSSSSGSQEPSCYLLHQTWALVNIEHDRAEGLPWLAVQFCPFSLILFLLSEEAVRELSSGFSS